MLETPSRFETGSGKFDIAKKFVQKPASTDIGKKF